MKKKIQLHRTSAISQEQYNICSLFLVHLYKMISPGYHFTQVKFCVFHFFIFSKFFNFFFKFLFIRLFGWWWGRRQTFCLLNFMSHKPYMIWPWLMVHMCKRIISLSFCFFLHFFQILIFGVSSGAKEQKKKSLKWEQFLSVRALHIWVCIYHMIVFFLTQV